MEKFCTGCGGLYIDDNELNVEPWGVCNECHPKVRRAAKFHKEF
jgi:hypothetical protein